MASNSENLNITSTNTSKFVCNCTDLPICACDEYISDLEITLIPMLLGIFAIFCILFHHFMNRKNEQNIEEQPHESFTDRPHVTYGTTNPTIFHV
jgi:hypothetical protein